MSDDLSLPQRVGVWALMFLMGPLLFRMALPCIRGDRVDWRLLGFSIVSTLAWANVLMFAWRALA